MDPRFIPHNSHLEAPEKFADRDPQLQRLKHQVYVHIPDLLQAMLNFPVGIYTLGGGRQVGKSTLVKQWMQELLHLNVRPQAIAYLSGELISDHQSLYQLLQAQISSMPAEHIKYLTIDEVTYIKGWDKAIKYAADSGLLEQTVLLLTGSDLNLIQEARMTFPGRRGTATRPDLHLYPMSFREFYQLCYGEEKTAHLLKTSQNVGAEALDSLYEAFQLYLMHGGYLTAINDYAKQGRISESTLATYSDWIRGDMLKRGKHEASLREVLAALIKGYTTQVTWNSLAGHLSIEHPATVAEYIHLLETMDAIFVQYALQEDKRLPAPKKARKVFFTDPFIYHSLRAWIFPQENPFEQQIFPALADAGTCAQLVEACVVTQYRRYYPTYFIKAEGEVDIAYIEQNRFWPVEIKWTNQMRPKDLKQLRKYENGKILTKVRIPGVIDHITTEPLPLALLRLTGKPS